MTRPLVLAFVGGMFAGHFLVTFVRWANKPLPRFAGEVHIHGGGTDTAAVMDELFHKVRVSQRGGPR